jgi:hypothetical protein
LPQTSQICTDESFHGDLFMNCILRVHSSSRVCIHLHPSLFLTPSLINLRLVCETQSLVGVIAEGLAIFLNIEK